MGTHTTQKDRFLGFAGGPCVVSAIGVPVWLLTAGLESLGLGPLTVCMMLLYLPAGAAAAGLLGWNCPTLREWGKSVLWAALVAWAWGFGGWGGLCLGVELQWALLAYLCFWALLFTAFLAMPSFLLMLHVLGSLEHLPTGWEPLWYGGIVLAGLLPALLFHLGALAGSLFRRNKTNDRPEKGGELHVL